MRSWIFALLAPLVLATLLLGACSENTGASTPAPTTELKVEAQEFSFAPAVFEATAGQPIKISLENAGSLEHDWSISEIPASQVSSSAGDTDHNMTGEMDVHTSAAAGQSSSVTFTPTAAGTYEFFCAVPGHKEAGMRGTLTVTAP